MALQYNSQFELISDNKIYHQNDPLIIRLRGLKLNVFSILNLFSKVIRHYLFVKHFDYFFYSILFRGENSYCARWVDSKTSLHSTI